MTTIENRQDIAGRLAAAMDEAETAAVKANSTHTTSRVEQFDLIATAVTARKAADALWLSYCATFKTEEK